MNSFLLFLSILSIANCSGESSCNPFYVRWPRVKLNFQAVANARLSLRACESACSLSEDPQVPGRRLECAALNHHPAPDGFSHHCDVFQPHQLQNVDGYVEADDRYSFFWKYCLNSNRRCGGDYAFTYLSDRYMDQKEVVRFAHTSSLEDCLSQCLEEKVFTCRSISFNRTDGGCHLSANSQLTKPGAVRLNNNPNFRIDYYENNCYNLSETFQFEQECRENGVAIKVKSKFPYTGALYGLYDFFTCRIEPKEETEFQMFFPNPTTSKNCSDSIRYKGDEMVLEVVLSTDGVEPLYFITPDDLTYQARCPLIKNKNITSSKLAHQPAATTNHTKDIDATAHALFSMLAKETSLTTNRPTSTTTKVQSTTKKATTTQKTTTTTHKPISTSQRTTQSTDKTTSNPTTTTPTLTTTSPSPTTTTSTTTMKKPTSTTTKPQFSPPGTSSEANPSATTSVGVIKTPIAFDIYKDGHPVEAVVVGSKITLAFTPHFPIPPDFMSIRGCQVEPVDPKYEWEREPLPIIREGCPADLVGLVCPPSPSDVGIKVTVEAFRYQTTPQVQYSCLVRVCPFEKCPEDTCSDVEGCPIRRKRALSLEEIRRALEADPSLARQIGISPTFLTKKPAHTVEDQLIALGGDHVVKRRLVVVNSEDQLRYYVRTGGLP